MKLMTVREARERHKPPITQDELAAKSGVDQTYISLVERLKRSPSDDIRKRLAKALGIAPSRLRFAAPPPATSVKPRGDRAGHTATADAVTS
jgi:transcriptional regulator with XRE-family HTH domain